MPAPLLQHVGHGPALEAQGVKIVGTVPQGLPPFTLPLWDLGLWQQLLVPALLISVVGFVESV
ncbi:MAG: SulP family inorganic anion transporter, partial [Hydrogenophaga sp.]|uniref:SulP family inorganic anion transporter n=1 Tax=Hydrogenophaga sp. TaxID=1904254 RepID=UPI00271E350D